MKKKVLEWLIHYLLILLIVTIIIMSYVTFEDLGLNMLSNVLLQSLILTVVSLWHSRKK